ncbi:hypothetical protein BDZ94DRAFT_1323628 [Collybia nuda]|uniref:Novel STAND NTPase 1 domain-containing protein n=1 Tax=Collybia nuda TaxID=64659 RepID=A0A9P5Y286_9AGAR|nr:hypothetical protein BDZ94DRAFT_1323628 [Collybia nuda]
MSFFSTFRLNKGVEQKREPRVPSSSEYALEGVKVSLNLLESAAALVPIPYVHTAIKVAIALIKAGEDIQSTLQDVEDLNKRVWSLMLVMIEPFRGKIAEEIPSEMKKDVEQLTSDLQHIKGVLASIASQPTFLTVVFKGLVKEKVEGCISRLDESLSKFQVSREINNAIHLWEMETGVKVVRRVAEEGLGVAKENLNMTARVADRVDELHSVLRNRLHDASSLPSRVMPTKPRFFYGRDEVVEGVVRTFLGEEHRHVALLGAGGMGKTSIALAVIQNDKIVEKFGDRRFWVPCVEGRSPTHFLDILVSCLKITRDTRDPLSDILYELEASPDPRVILLDNFETPWNLDVHQTEIEHILCALANLPHIKLFVTMRSNFPPSDNIEWYSQRISSLDIGHARRVYNAIQPGADSDPALDELLMELGYMALAITLMARLGKKSGSLPKVLLQTWQKAHTNMLGKGDDAKQSIDVSISLSVYSTPMQNEPSAFLLLAILSMFPAGTQYKNLTHWAPTILNLPGALAALTDASLADQRDATIYIHPVIRYYMLHSERFPGHVRAGVRAGIYQFMRGHKSEPGDLSFVDDVMELSNEETNIRFILLGVIKYDFNSNAVDALLIYCWHQHWTHPRLDIIKYVLQVSRAEKKALYIAESLFCLGHMYFKLDDHDKALTALMEAKDIFVAKNHKSRVARCFIKIADCYLFNEDVDACWEAVEAAQCDLEEIGDELLIADARLLVGQYLTYLQIYEEAMQNLTEAQSIYLRLNKPMGAAHCICWMSWTYYHQEEYIKARRAVEMAIGEYERLDHREGASDAFRLLSRILKEIGSYDEAIVGILQSIRVCENIGAPLGIAQGLEVLGKLYSTLERHDEALSVYKHALEILRPVSGSHAPRISLAQCLHDISYTYRDLSRFEDAERLYAEYEEMGIDVTQYQY